MVEREAELREALGLDEDLDLSPARGRGPDRPPGAGAYDIDHRHDAKDIEEHLMETAEIKRRWLEFFAQRDHAVVPSASLLTDDPNLLFVPAGMVPFKPYLLGQEAPPWKRATSVQKCVRTLDIEEVGRTTRHGTFFQMNGNFSFGDYFKEGAIELAWELVTSTQADGGFGFDPDKIWVTVFHDDDEAAALWKRIAGLPDERVQRRGLEDNYWHMGVPGPGGPSSEIYVDRGPEHGPDGGPIVDEDRFLEIWNLVFMQSELSAVRSKADFDIRGDLPRKNIDTGLGLERTAYLLQGVDNLYEIDEVFPVLKRAADLAGKRYGASHEDDVRLRIVADHVRSALDAHRRRRHAGQRDPGVRAAAAAAPGGPLDAAARRGGPGPARAAADQPRRDVAVLPGGGDRLRADLDGGLRRGGGVPLDAAGRDDDLRPVRRESSTAGRDSASSRRSATSRD